MNKFLALLIPTVIAVVSMKSTEALPTDQRLSNDNTARASSSLDWLNPFTWFSGKRERRNNEDMRVSVIQQHAEQHPKKILRRLGVNDKLAFAAQEERPHDAKVLFTTSVSPKQKAAVMEGQGQGEPLCVCRCDCCDCCPCIEGLDYDYTE